MTPKAGRAFVLLLCAGFSGCAVIAKDHEVDLPMNSRGDSAQFVQRLKAALEHGELADVKVMESTLGGRLELYRERTQEDNKTNRRNSYSYQWKGLPFPVSEHFPKITPQADLRPYYAWYYIDIPAGGIQAQASFNLDLNDEPPSCLSIDQVEAALGVGQKGNPFNTSPHAKRLRQLYRYRFAGANNIVVFFSTVYQGNGCVYEIFAHQNHPEQNRGAF